MPGLSVLKFHSVSGVLRPLQISEASTSKEPVTSHLESVDMQAHTQRAVEEMQIKENLDPITTHRYATVSRDYMPMHATAAVEDVQINQNLEHRKKQQQTVATRRRVKRVALSQSEHVLYKKLMLVGVKLSKCRNKVKNQAKKIKAMQNLMTNPQFLKTLDELPSTSKILTLLQFREHKKGNKGRRFTLKEKIIALSFLKQSPKGYRFLRKIFILPSRQTLLKLLNMADINPGINKNMIQQIKTATEKMKLNDKICIVLFDEMSLKPNVTYNERKDQVCGFVTNGLETQPDYADHAQVFMVRGLLKNYKQPVAYTFSQAATKGPELAKQLKAVITELLNAGLIVVATVCDQGTNNVNCIKHLLQETRGNLLRKGEEMRENVYIINEQEIIPLYDPPHLIKCIRNNLISKDLKYKKNGEVKLAKWAHVMALHKENPGYKGIRLVPKLTDAHCDPSKIPRMKVKNATQVFSQTVASNMGYLADKGILPAEAKDTADILLFFDKLFDSMNGSFGKRKKHGKPLLGPATPTSIHHKTWKECKVMMKDMRFINNKTSNDEYVPTINNWVWTLEGFELLLKKIESKYGVTSVWLRHLNQDPIENFFGSIRSHGCRNVNPTPERFESAFTTLLVNSLSSVHAPGANCESDNCETLHEVLITSGGIKEQTNCELSNIPDITFTPLEEKNDPRVIGGLQYVSGYFVKSAKKKIFKGCVECKNNLISDNQHEYLKYREYANKKWLCSPSDSLLNCISNLQDINYLILKENLYKQNLRELIKTMIFIAVDFSFVKCRIHKEKLTDFLIKISCRFFIYNYCKEINNILINKRECDDDTDSYKVKAKKLSKKCFKRKK
ncbi:hypothetical protein PYW07_007377 [Mythimna separata]|uniref:Transposable element P transposase n=1 Tax=Mythimna separata TaxID=271217 RepID=A0AAD7Z3T9_MYTSE|nr:hypothetical protein PYW07_007377 [Mythimna separata]